MAPTASSALFKPMNIGQHTLSNRIVLAPLTRLRATDDNVPIVPLVKEYYTQRASTPGTLLITEATCISPESVGMPNVPGIWNSAQISAWKEIVDSVHKAGGIIYLQLWAFGRAADPKIKAANGTGDIVSSSNVPINDKSPTPRALTEDEIWSYIGAYAQGAKNAIAAGFDGVEIHGANGYLVDQFTQDVCNTRTDSWGGSIEKNCRFAVEVSRAVVEAVGAERTAIRLSPWSTFQGMKVKEPVPLFSHLIGELKKLKLAYLHIVEARISGSGDCEADEASSNAPFVNLWDVSPVLLAGGYTAEEAERDAEKYDGRRQVGIVFGRHFIANPDLVYRIKNGVEFTKYDRKTFYIPKSEKGYIDYPFASEDSRPRI